MFWEQILYQSAEGAFIPWLQMMTLVGTAVWKWLNQAPKPSRMCVVLVYVLMLWLISQQPETERVSIVECLFVLSSLLLAVEMTLFVWTEVPEKIQTLLAVITTTYTCTSEKVSFYYKSLLLYMHIKTSSAPTQSQLSMMAPLTISKHGADL